MKYPVYATTIVSAADLRIMWARTHAEGYAPPDFGEAKLALIERLWAATHAPAESWQVTARRLADDTIEIRHPTADGWRGTHERVRPTDSGRVATTIAMAVGDTYVTRDEWITGHEGSARSDGPWTRIST